MAGDLASTVAGGDLRASLEALRDRLAEDLDADDAQSKPCPKCKSEVTFKATGAALASVAKQLGAFIDQLDSLPKAEGSAVSELAAARRDRRATQVPDAAAVGGERPGRGRSPRK